MAYDENDEWQPPADIKPWMVCAACKYGTHIITSARHFDELMHSQIKAAGYRHQMLDAEQGFIDQWGRFYNRTDAMVAVRRSGQPFSYKRNGSQDTELYSEGLY